MISIAPLEERDIRELAELLVKSWQETYRGIVPDDYLAHLSVDKREEKLRANFAEKREKCRCFIARDLAGNLIGFASTGPNRYDYPEIDGELQGIAVKKNYQGQGISQNLLRESLEQLIRDGFQKVLVVSFAANTRANQFYKKMGALPIPMEKDFDLEGYKIKQAAHVWEKIPIVKRHPCIKHFSDIQSPDDAHYPGSSELLSFGSAFGKYFNFERLGIHHEVLKPGRRTSWPHAESTEDEFIFVIEGYPHAWIDGNMYELKPGDGVGFKAGTGITHTFINDSKSDVRLLAVGDRTRADNKIYYAKHPQRNIEKGDQFWKDWPKREMGPHDGKPK